MNKSLSLFFVSLCLTSCFGKKSLFNEEEGVVELGIPTKIEYYKNIPGKAFQFSDTPFFVIINNRELQDAINEIKNADNPELWKGAGWNKIEIYYPDTILNINTDNMKIGKSANGTFYYLKEDNFIVKRLKKRE